MCRIHLPTAGKAGEAVELTFHNEDVGVPHNVAIVASDGTKVFSGEKFAPSKLTPDEEVLAQRLAGVAASGSCRVAVVVADGPAAARPELAEGAATKLAHNPNNPTTPS